MNPNSSAALSPQTSQNRLESAAYYIFLITLVLAPVAFWPSPYIALDLVKTIVIAVGTLAAAILFGCVALKERVIALPPKKIVWTALLIVVSLVLSSLASIHISKSLFGQGFEIGTASFIILMFVSALIAFTLVYRRTERAVIFYVGMVAAYLITYVFQLLRLVFGTGFASFSILNSVTSTVLGGWYDLAIYSAVVAVISLSALMFLKLSRRMKIAHWVLTAIAAIAMYIVNDVRVWEGLVLVFLGLSIYCFCSKLFVRRISWIPLSALIVAAVFTYFGTSLSRPVVEKLHVNYSELSLPWQMTLDVTGGAIKNYPLFGVGPNHFAQAFLTYKPAGINTTSAWGVEFANGFGLIPTFIATQGIVGSILWILFFIFFALVGTHVLRSLPEDPSSRFIIISSFMSSVFLWILLIIEVPSHTLILYSFVLTGIFFATIAANRISSAAQAYTLAPVSGTKFHKAMPILISVCIVIVAFWGLIHVKKTVAMGYFGAGVKQLTVASNPALADIYFKKALSFDSSDISWQGRAEAALAEANRLTRTVTGTSTASTSQTILAQISATISNGVTYADNAIAYDPTNYYSYISKARISELAANLHVDKAYDSTVSAYAKAIALNPQNPSTYLSSARFQASQNKLDDALKTIGTALQVKNNYLEAVFLLSQIYASKGDLANATIAAQVATQLNPKNPLLYFQLGLLNYNNKNFEASREAFAAAVNLQSDYSNAKYFLGLSYARLNKMSDAITQFQELATSNPDNQEVATILANLKSGKSIFTDAKTSLTSSPEKRSSLPIKEQKR